MSASRFSISIDKPNALWTFDKRQLRRVMRQAGAEVSRTAKALMRASGGGRSYSGSGGSAYRPYKPGRHTASRPGEAPAAVTRTLMRSIRVRPFKTGEGVAVRATAFYAKILEGGAKGGRGKGRVVEPRPFLSAALAQRSGAIGPRIKAAVDQGIAFSPKREAFAAAPAPKPGGG